jgi:hypothetical protein
MSDGGEVTRLWAPEDWWCSTAAVYTMLRKQAILCIKPYSLCRVSHHAWKAHNDVWQQLLVEGTPELAVLLRVSYDMHDLVGRDNEAAGLTMVDAKFARAASGEAQAACQAKATAGLPPRIAQSAAAAAHVAKLGIPGSSTWRLTQST